METNFFDIEQHEKEIIEDFENGEFVSVKNLKEEMDLAKQAASNFIEPLQGNQRLQSREKLRVAETIQAMREARAGKLKSFATIDQLMADLHSEN